MLANLVDVIPTGVISIGPSQTAPLNSVERESQKARVDLWRTAFLLSESMFGSLVIRHARPGDGDGLARLWIDMCDYYADLAPEHFQLPAREGLIEWFEADLTADPPDAISLVGEVDGRIVGWIWAHILAPREDAHQQLLRELSETRLVVEALVVERPFWRQGIGTQLMRAVEDWASAKGATLSTVDTYVHSPVSMPFYEHGMGYSPRRVTFQKRLPGASEPG